MATYNQSDILYSSATTQYDGTSTASTRTATGSGTGTSTTVKVVIKFRTATGSGTGTSTSTELRIITVGGISFAAGSSTSVGVHFVLRTATAQGSGNSSTVSILNTGRTATGSGSGTSTVVGARLIGRQATGIGQSSDLAIWVKSHIFRVPYTETYPGGYFGGGDAANRLQRYNRTNIRALNLYKLTDGTYTTVTQRDMGQVVKLWHGGRDHFLTDAEVVELTEAGFGASIT
jgi:hypothetical protein